MKKLFLLLTFFALTFVSQANVVSDAKKTAVGVIDSTTKVIKDVAYTVDTSSLSKQIYGDVKQALVGFAAALKVGVEHVYIVLVKQQVVNAIIYSIPALLSILFIILAYVQWGKIVMEKDNYNSSQPKEARPVVFTGIFIFLTLFCFIIAATHFDVIVMGFVNPEYGAMTDIMNFVKTIKR